MAISVGQGWVSAGQKEVAHSSVYVWKEMGQDKGDGWIMGGMNPINLI
jgi:hypothetical protein